MCVCNTRVQIMTGVQKLKSGTFLMHSSLASESGQASAHGSNKAGRRMLDLNRRNPRAWPPFDFKTDPAPERGRDSNIIPPHTR